MSFADDVFEQVEDMASRGFPDLDLAELWLGRVERSVAKTDVIITAGRHNGTTFFRVLGTAAVPDNVHGCEGYELALMIFDNSWDPSEVRYVHGSVGLGGDAADILERFWDPDRPLFDQWSGLRRYS